MKLKALIPVSLVPLLIGIFSIISLPVVTSEQQSPVQQPLAQQNGTPIVVTVEVPVTVEVTRVVTVVVTPTFTPLPPTPTPLPADMTVDDDPFMGSAEAPVKVVEFSDFQCGFCARFAAQTLTPLVEHYGDLIQFVYRDFPIFGEPSINAAMATECAADQNDEAFWEFHDALFANHNSEDPEDLTLEWLTGVADELGLNVEEWNTCLASEDTMNEIALDYYTGVDWGVTGTPAFFINGKLLSGAQPLEVFYQVIDAELVALGFEPPER